MEHLVLEDARRVEMDARRVERGWMRRELRTLEFLVK
jgi:hypothetical protein